MPYTMPGPGIDLVLIAEDDFLALPREVDSYIRTYWRYLVTTPRGVYFEMRHRHWAHIEALLKTSAKVDSRPQQRIGGAKTKPRQSAAEKRKKAT
jgi:hypothetical protein